MRPTTLGQALCVVIVRIKVAHVSRPMLHEAERCTQEWQLPKSKAKTNQGSNSLGWIGPLVPHLRRVRLGLVPAWGLT